MTNRNDVEESRASSPELGLEPDRAPADVDTFDAFYRHEYAGQLRRAVLLVGSEADASEAVAHAFTNVFERWDKLDAPGPYLNRAVVNACRDVGRGRARLRVVPTPDDRHGVDSYASHELMAALLALPYKQRAVVVLKHWVGLRESDIAEQLDIAAGSVGPTLARAYKRPKPFLQEVPQ